MGLSLPGRGRGSLSRRGCRDRRANRSRLSPQTESLERRQLLSGSAHPTHADLLVPPAAEVANATSVLESRAGQDFQKLATDLQTLEQASKVRPGQFAELELDATTLDLAIKTSSTLASKQSSVQLYAVQNTSTSLLASATGERLRGQLEKQVADSLSGVIVNYVLSQAQVAATLPNGVVSNALVQDTYSQMKLIAREAESRRPSMLRS